MIRLHWLPLELYATFIFQFLLRDWRENKSNFHSRKELNSSISTQGLRMRGFPSYPTRQRQMCMCNFTYHRQTGMCIFSLGFKVKRAGSAVICVNKIPQARTEIRFHFNKHYGNFYTSLGKR